jgi:tRNA (guanine-N7-)-methyltransferase
MAPQRHTDPFATTPKKLNPRVNVYVDKILQAERDGILPIAFGEGLRGRAGQWRSTINLFHTAKSSLPAPLGPDAKLIVEIGCHKGRTLKEMAGANPGYGFIGIDITYKRVVMTAERAVAAGLRNTYQVMANAVGLDQIFNPQEVDGLVIFFPDPWVKKQSQAKNRLVSPEFAARAAAVLKPGGFIWFKTDQESYFQAAGATFQAAGMRLSKTAALNTEESEPLLARDYSSTFEAKFQKQGLPTYSGVWHRPTC